MRPGAWSAPRRRRPSSASRLYASIEELLADDAVDAVTIASPIGLHSEHGRLALEAGKHVHVNKTMTTTVAEADALIDARRRNGLRIVASPGEVLRPQLTRTRELIAEARSASSAGRSAAARSAATTRRRAGADGGAGGADRSVVVLPEAGRRADVRHDGLRAARADERPRPGPAGHGAVGHARRRAEFRGRSDRDRGGRQHGRCSLDFGDGLFAVAHGTAAGTIDDSSGGVLLRHRGDDRRRAAQRRAVRLPRARADAATRRSPTGTRRCGCCRTSSAPHREIPESHVFEDIMQLVDWVRDGTPVASHRRARPPCDRHHREQLPRRRQRNEHRRSERRSVSAFRLGCAWSPVSPSQFCAPAVTARRSSRACAASNRSAGRRSPRRPGHPAAADTGQS